MSLLDRLSKAGASKDSSILSESKFFNKKTQVATDIPIINIALSSKIGGGLISGLTFLAGPSKHFKSLLGLVLMRAYLKAYPDAVILFYDSEHGITPEYIKANGIDPSRVIHIPVEHIEQLKFDLSKRLQEISRGDRVFIFMDSIGNIASKKEAEDALDGKSAADMTRAKALKSLWRIVTPQLTSKDIPCVAINHTYETMELYSKQIMSGGTGGMYSANQVFIIGKQQEKDSTGIIGWNFVINIEKSRFVKERSKLTFTVTYKGGISRWSGLIDLATESGHITKTRKRGYVYNRVDVNTGEIDPEDFTEEQTNTKAFWLPILTDAKFQAFIEEKYGVSNTALITDDDEVLVEDDEDLDLSTVGQ